MSSAPKAALRSREPRRGDVIVFAANPATGSGGRALVSKPMGCSVLAIVDTSKFEVAQGSGRLEDPLLPSHMRSQPCHTRLLIA